MIIWGLVVLFFTAMGMMIFGQIKSFRGFGSTFSNMLQVALGTYDLTDFGEIGDKAYQGTIFTLVLLILSVLLLTNYVVAIMMDKYANL